MKLTRENCQERLIAVLNLITDGILKVQLLSDEDTYGVDVRFKVVGTELEIVVFNDCGQWDYLDSAYLNGELVWEFEDGGPLTEFRPTTIDNWKPWFSG